MKVFQQLQQQTSASNNFLNNTNTFLNTILETNIYNHSLQNSMFPTQSVQNRKPLLIDKFIDISSQSTMFHNNLSMNY